MSILSKLAKIAAIAGPVIAAPFTGGGSLLGLSAAHAAALGAGLSGVGSVLGSGAASSQKGRYLDANTQSDLNRQNNADSLSAAQFNLGAGQTRAQQVAKGDLMAANIPQSQRSGDGRNVSFSGGIGPQYFGPNTTQAGQTLSRQSLDALMNGTDIQKPAMSSIKKPSILEQIGGIGGIVGGVAGAIQDPTKNYKPYKPPNTSYDPNNPDLWP